MRALDAPRGVVARARASRRVLSRQNRPSLVQLSMISYAFDLSSRISPTLFSSSCSLYPPPSSSLAFYRIVSPRHRGELFDGWITGSNRVVGIRHEGRLRSWKLNNDACNANVYTVWCNRPAEGDDVFFSQCNAQDGCRGPSRQDYANVTRIHVSSRFKLRSTVDARESALDVSVIRHSGAVRAFRNRFFPRNSPRRRNRRMPISHAACARVCTVWPRNISRNISFAIRG